MTATALALDDPLWRKLDDAYGSADLPEDLRQLVCDWDEEAADELLFGALIHQETCYTATYAAFPHLLELAETTTDTGVRKCLVLWLGWLAVCAFETAEPIDDGRHKALLQAFPYSADEWKKIRRFKGVANNASISQQSWETMPWSGFSDHEKAQLESLGAYFLASLPRVAALCQATYKTYNDPEALDQYLMGFAAALGLRGVARLLDRGEEGYFDCPNCETPIAWQVFGDSIACYDQPLEAETSATSAAEQPSYLDWQDGAPTRQAGFIERRTDATGLTPNEAQLWATAHDRPDGHSALLLSGFLGLFACPHCGFKGRPAPHEDRSGFDV